MIGELKLITDRTFEDVLRAKRLFDRVEKGIATETEISEFLAGLKGAYNASDLNRVESACMYVSGRLGELPSELREYAKSKGVAWDTFFGVGYVEDDVSVNVKLDWKHTDFFDKSNQNRYLKNIVVLSKSFGFDELSLPNKFDGFDYSNANAIEERLVEINGTIDFRRKESNRAVDNTAKSWYYNGELYGGEI